MSDLSSLGVLTAFTAGIVSFLLPRVVPLVPSYVSYVASGLLLAGATVSAQTVQPLRADGVEIFYGVIPAEIILGYADDRNKRKMHGGSPAWGEHYHLIVTLFDGASKERIPNAEVKATVFAARRPDNRLAGSQKRLEPMLFAGAASYGNYFNMPAPAPYRIELEIRRAGARVPIKIPIEFRHSLVTTKPSP